MSLVQSTQRYLIRPIQLMRSYTQEWDGLVSAWIVNACVIHVRHICTIIVDARKPTSIYFLHATVLHSYIDLNHQNLVGDSSNPRSLYRLAYFLVQSLAFFVNSLLLSLNSLAMFTSIASSGSGAVRICLTKARTVVILVGGFQLSGRKSPKHMLPLSSFEMFG